MIKKCFLDGNRDCEEDCVAFEEALPRNCVVLYSLSKSAPKPFSPVPPSPPPIKR